MAPVIQEYAARFNDPAQRVGATYADGQGVYVRIWAPKVSQVSVEWIGAAPQPLQKQERGYFSGFFPAVKPGARYYFILDGQKRIPDPASRYQPEGVFGPSEVVDLRFPWQNMSAPVSAFSAWVIYEIHTGTFSDSHDFAGIIADLPRLRTLGITALEIMPVGQCPGTRNWGYDGVFPHAVQHNYGGPKSLKALVDACHGHGMAIILDVVFNHLGPEGNVLFGCAPYTQEKYHSPWGPSLNFDGHDSFEVRHYFLQAAWQWLTEYQFDGLRLDAVHAMLDTSPVTILQEINALKDEAQRKTGRALVTIAETDTNNPLTVTPLAKNGFGFDAQWADDLHHNIHVFLTGENKGYYSDYGSIEQFEKIYREGMAYNGVYSPRYKRIHGGSYEGIDRKRLVVGTQNHDQVGNRLKGDRLGMLVDFPRLKLAAAMVMLSPFTPFIFMGEEFASTQPFLFFADYQSESLRKNVIKGRQQEWKEFDWDQEPPDPFSPETFQQCVLSRKIFPASTHHALMTDYYKVLIALSKKVRAMNLRAVECQDDLINLHYEKEGHRLNAYLSLSAQDKRVNMDGPCELLIHAGDYDTAPAKPWLHHAVLELPAYSAAVTYA